MLPGFDEYGRQKAARTRAEDEKNRDELRQALRQNLALTHQGQLPSREQSLAAAIRDHEAGQIELRRQCRSEIWQDIALARDTWEPPQYDSQCAAVPRAEFDQLQQRLGTSEVRIGELTTRLAWLTRWVCTGLAMVKTNEVRLGELATQLTWLTRWVCAGLVMARTFAARLRSGGRSRPSVDPAVAKLECELANGRTMADIEAECRPSLAARLGVSERGVYRVLDCLRTKLDQSDP
jgi:hypothetical protein